MSEVKLNPCPFCGELPTITKHFKHEMYSFTHRCPVIGPITRDFRERAQGHADMWNTRCESDFDAQRLRADTAEAEIEVLKREVECRISNEVNAVEGLAAAEQRIAELISEVASRDAALEEIGCPFEGVSDLFKDYAKGGKRYQWLRANLSVDDFPKPHPEWSQPSEVESRRIDDLVDAALNPNPEAESHESSN